MSGALNLVEEKLNLIRIYETQNRTVDYLNYIKGLAKVRAFHTPVNQKRNGAVEGFWAVGNKEYCDLVCNFYGNVGVLKDTALVG